VFRLNLCLSAAKVNNYVDISLGGKTVALNNNHIATGGRSLSRSNPIDHRLTFRQNIFNLLPVLGHTPVPVDHGNIDLAGYLQGKLRCQYDQLSSCKIKDGRRLTAKIDDRIFPEVRSL